MDYPARSVTSGFVSHVFVFVESGLRLMLHVFGFCFMFCVKRTTSPLGFAAPGAVWWSLRSLGFKRLVTSQVHKSLFGHDRQLTMHYGVGIDQQLVAVIELSTFQLLWPLGLPTPLWNQECFSAPNKHPKIFMWIQKQWPLARRVRPSTPRVAGGRSSTSLRSAHRKKHNHVLWRYLVPKIIIVIRNCLNQLNARSIKC